MTLTYREFAQGLRAQIEHGHDVVQTSRWAYRQLTGARELDAGLREEILKVVAMEDGPEFELSDRELLDLANALYGRCD